MKAGTLTANASTPVTLGCEEQGMLIPCGEETLLGILSVPATEIGILKPELKDVAVLVVVGGPQYRAGSHRQFVQLCRHLATQGVASLRFDVRGMGDSTGAQRCFEQLGDDIAAAIDALQFTRPAVRRVVLWGLCDGASAALLYVGASADARVAGLCLLNPWVRSEATLARTHVKHYYWQRLKEISFWRKLLRGGVGLGAATGLLDNVRRAGRLGSTTPSTSSDLPYQQRMAQAWSAFDGQVLLMMSERDLTAREFDEYCRADASWQAALRRRPPRRLTITDADHTCSTPGAQLAVEQATCDWLLKSFAPSIEWRLPQQNTNMPQRPLTLPRLPVLGWSAFGGAAQAPMPTLLDRDRDALLYTTSGRAAILLALEALGVGPGQEVLLPTYHCPTMVAPVVSLRASPRFYPIDDKGSPRLDWLEAQDLSRVRAILVPHFFGLPQPMQDLRDWCDRQQIAMIEDCAHALFGRSGDRPIGSWGDLAISSLTKFLPVPEGGCLVANREVERAPLTKCAPLHQVKAALDIAEDGARHGRLAGLNWWIQAPLELQRKFRQRNSAPPQSSPQGHGGAAIEDPSMLVDAQLAHRAPAAASRWVAQWLPRFRIVDHRRKRYKELSERLAGLSGLRPLIPRLPDNCAPYVFPLWVEHPDPGYAELRRRRMPVSRWDRLWPDTPELAEDQGLVWSHHVIQLACHQDLSDADVDTLVNCLVGIFANPSGASTEVIRRPPIQTTLPVGD